MSLDEIKERYYALLKAYVYSPQELHLAESSALGRQLVLAGVPPEEIAEIHHEAINLLAEEEPDLTLVDVARRISAPLMEMLMAYGLAFRERIAAIEEWRKLSSVVEASPNAVLIVNTQYLIEYVNPAFCRLSGLTAGELVGRPLEVLRPVLNLGDLWDTIIAANKRGETWRGDMWTPEVQGERRLLDMTIFPIRGPDGEVTHFAALGRDVTEQRRLQEEVMKVEKLESLGVLAGGIAHDFNNILMGVLGNIALARMYQHDRHMVESVLADAEKAALRARGLTQQLLVFAKGGAPVLKTETLQDVIRDTAEFVLRGSNVRGVYELPADLWPANVDKGQFSQVIQNLVLNAVQAMPSGGTLTIRGENLTLSHMQVPPLPAGRYVRITVEDEGIGIPQTYLRRIFEPYFTTKQAGSGLGLSIVYSIMRQHGGTVTVESELGKGARFYLYLPAAESTVAEKPAGQPVLRTGSARVLVMDDDEMVQQVLKGMLRHLGYQVDVVNDGKEMLEAYASALAGGEPYGVVIMDLTVPGGMGGKEAVRELKRRFPQARAIVSSGYASDPIMASYRDYGFDGVIPKPFTMEDLSQVVYEVLNG
jgi:PAS domain S-box-containing protein